MNQFVIGILLIVIIFALVGFFVQSGFFSAGLTGETDEQTSSGGSNFFRSFFGLSPSTPPGPSEFAGDVSVEFVSLGTPDENFARITLRSHADRTVVTGWKVRTERGTVLIPLALDLFGPGARRSLQNIVLNNEDVLFVISGKEGRNARVAGNEWQVWIEDPFLPFPHGTITLLDTKNRVVDEYEY